MRQSPKGCRWPCAACLAIPTFANPLASLYTFAFKTMDAHQEDGPLYSLGKLVGLQATIHQANDLAKEDLYAASLELLRQVVPTATFHHKWTIRKVTQETGSMSEVQCLKQELICYKKKLGDANREIQTLREQLQEAKKIISGF